VKFKKDWAFSKNGYFFIVKSNALIYIDIKALIHDHYFNSHLPTQN
jgi:hypothetical protein